jgi:hypothetical protein
MALPKIDLPLFELKLPSTGRKVKYRPFTVKEEKILLVAQESNDREQELLAAKQIVNNCLVKTDISKLAMFDLEYVLLVLRSRSVDNAIKFTIGDPDTKERVEMEINIDDVKIVKDKEHSKRVRINDEYTLFLKYPTIDQFTQIITMDATDPLVNYYIMTSSLDQIASEEETHKFSDYSQEEVDDFMNDMTADVMKEIQKFFETMPKLRHEMKYTNSEGTEKTFVIEGMRSFFA